MSRMNPSPPSEILIPRDLDAGSAPDMHQALLESLSGDAASSVTLRMDLEGEGVIWPLALQLIASAERSVPADRIAFGPAAQAALATLATPKEETR